MRPPSFLILASMAPLAFAFGYRGAAERAMFYAAYMAEEVWLLSDNSNGGDIATDCIGTRQGIRGQANRCTLQELLQHLWATSVGDVYDAHNQRIRLDNGQYMTANDIQPTMDQVNQHFASRRYSFAANNDRNDILKITSAINTFKTPREAGVRPAGGFTGTLREGSVFSSLGYFDTMQHFATYMVDTKMEIQSYIRDTISDTDPQRMQKLQLKKWMYQMAIGVEHTRIVRIKDGDQVRMRQLGEYFNAPLQRRFLRGTDATIVTTIRDQDDRVVNFGLGRWEAPNFEQTFQEALRQDPNINRAAAQIAFDNAIQQFNALPASQEHARIIQDMELASRAMAC